MSRTQGLEDFVLAATSQSFNLESFNLMIFQSPWLRMSPKNLDFRGIIE